MSGQPKKTAMRQLLTALLMALSAAAWVAEASPSDKGPGSLVELGRRIYQDGVDESGALIRGESAAKVVFLGKQAACIRCHRKSGLGTSEGKNVVTPITGAYLFPVAAGRDGSDDATVKSTVELRARSRSGIPQVPYTPETFARSLREGVNKTGKAMDPLMPRYDLTEREMEGLAVYLKSLSDYSDPSVDETTIHFATVILPDAAPQQSQAMLDVLNAFFADMNSGTRSEKQRRTVATEAMFRSYREWKLHVWKLTGPPEAWKAQLDKLYRQQPVFAVLSGIGSGSWQPLDEFCERHEVPCLFPNNDLPAPEGGYYSFYFSRGMSLEADVLAKQFEANLNRSNEVVQVFRPDDSRSAFAAKIFRDHIEKSGKGDALVDWTLPDDQIEKSWQKLLSDNHPKTLLMWLNGEDLARLGDWGVGKDSVREIFLSASMLGIQRAEDSKWLPEDLFQSSDRIRLVYPYKLPQKTSRDLLRTKAWLKSKKIPLNDIRILANTYFVATLAGDTYSHLLSHFSKDYFIELIEHMISKSITTSVYPQLNLGPGQRIASKGAYLVKYSARPSGGVDPLTGWLVPY